MGKLKLKPFFVVLLWLLLTAELQAKDWRGVMPLKSTRADVERLFGKPNALGRYQFQEERAYVNYSEGLCVGAYRPLGKANCKCLIPKDTVLSVYVQLELPRSFSNLRLDKTKYVRQSLLVGPPMATYTNLKEGIIYTVDESDDDIVDIEYLPTSDDCQRIIYSNAPKQPNAWHGLVPLHSNRTDVERLLGPLKTTSGPAYVYETENERVTVLYSTGGCAVGRDEWNVPRDTVVEMTVNPWLSFLMDRLNLEPGRYERQEHPPLPETPESGKLVSYVNDKDGVIVRSRLDGEREEVISITYRPSSKDGKLRCDANKQAAHIY
jgi:hypothetical protein